MEGEHGDALYMLIWNRTMKSSAIVLGKGREIREKDGRGEPNQCTM
jgi:hypothetical protein